MHFGINVDQINVLWSFVSIFSNALLLKMSSQEFVSEKTSLLDKVSFDNIFVSLWMFGNKTNCFL